MLTKTAVPSFLVLVKVIGFDAIASLRYIRIHDCELFQATESDSGDVKFLDRLYSYRDAFDLHVPEVSMPLC